SRAAKWCIGKFAEPQLEHQQTPEVGGAVGLTAQMLVDQGTYGGGTEIAALVGSAREQGVLEQRAQIGAQPLADWHAKPHLRSRKDRRRQTVVHQAAEQPLR